MSKKIKIIYLIIATLILTGFLYQVVFKKYYSGDDRLNEISRLHEKYFYLNLHKNVAYTGDEKCKSCHSDIHETFHKTGMGMSLFKPSADKDIEDFANENIVYDQKSDYYYQVYKKGNEYFQKEYRKDNDGVMIHELEKRIDYVMGSGNNTRSYIYSENGFFYEMPVSWFTEKAKWDMSPGYEKFNLRFSRPVIEECMNCHNSYSGFTEYSENKFDPHLKEGIGCERCHGPGELHVLRQTEKSDLFESIDKDTIDRTIVNPVNLPLEENLSVCFQCHLQGDVRVFAEDKKQSDFRPGMKLEEVKTVFIQDNVAEGDFKIASHAARMFLSKCFVKSNGGMTCLTCHDPHVPVESISKEFFNSKCLSCHNVQDETFKTLKEEHTQSSDCISCHMKQGGTRDVQHVNFTDHWIRKETDIKKFAAEESKENQKDDFYKTIKLKNFNNSGDQYAEMNLGIAYVSYYDVKHPNPEYLKYAVPLLEENLKKFPEHKNGLYHLGLAYLKSGRINEAINIFQKLTDLDPGNAPAYNQLGNAFEKAKNYSRAIDSYRSSLKIFPENIKTLNSLGNLYYNSGKISESLDAYLKALSINSGNVNVLNNLGDINLYKLKNTESAKDYLVKAVGMDPDFIPALNNLGNYYMLTGDTKKAENIFNEVLKKDPANVLSMGNLAVMYEDRGEISSARKMLEKILKTDPNDPRARQMLDKLK